MAISDAKKRKIGNELVDWIYLGIRTGARRSTEEYRRLLLENRLDEAKASLTRAVNMPRRARARITTWIAGYDAINGAGSAQTFLASCLSIAGTVTLSEIDAELTMLENQAQILINNNQSGWTLDQVATAIENQLEWEAKDWVFPLPVDYVDIELI